MRNTNKAFTLVELIVVITILAILGTIAFISLQGYTGEAKNSKVTSDLRNIASAIETASTRNGSTLWSMITNTNNVNKLWSWALNFNNGSLDTDPNTSYLVGNIDFGVIGQNGEDFKDPNAAAEDTDYLFWVLVNPEFKGYQLAGQIIENDFKKARITGTYYKVNEASDSDGLIVAASSSSTWALSDGEEIGIEESESLYQ